MNPKMHWSDFSGWVLVEFMYAQVNNAIMAIVSIVNYVALICDEVNMVDIGSWISIHVYMMQKWVKIPMLTSLQKVIDGARVDNLTIVIMDTL
jgi:hypothetical protein